LNGPKLCSITVLVEQKVAVRVIIFHIL